MIIKTKDTRTKKRKINDEKISKSAERFLLSDPYASLFDTVEDTIMSTKKEQKKDCHILSAYSIIKASLMIAFDEGMISEKEYEKAFRFLERKM